MRVVLDSNILLVALGQRSRFKPIWAAFLEGVYEVVVSDDILYEYEEIIDRNGAEGVSDLVMEIFIISSNVIHKKIYYNWNVIPMDADDNKFFDAAVAGNADFIITNDTHFNAVVKNYFPKIEVINADEFLKLLDQHKRI